MEQPPKAEITTCPQCCRPKPTSLSFSQTDTQTLREPTGMLGGRGGMLCSSSFEVFNSSFVIYSSTHISSISVLAQQFHSQRLIFIPVAQGLCPASGWQDLFCPNSEILTELSSLFLSPTLSSRQFRLGCP